MLLTMVASTGTMWGQTRETKTEGFETATAATTYNSTATVATNQSDCGIGWSIYYGNVSTTQAITGNNSCLIRYYTADAKLGYAKTTTGIQGLSNITFNAKVTNTGNKMGVWYSTDGDNWTALATDVTLTNSAASKSYDIPNSSSSNTYYVKIGLTTGSSTNKKDLIFDDVVFTYSTGGGSTVSTPTITPNGGSFIDSQEITLSCNTEEATIYYTLDGNDPTTSSTVYSTPFTITETKTVKAYAVKDGLTDSNIADATFTKVTPMTVAEALAASPTNDVYVTGIISTITEVNTGYHNATYRISDDGTTTSEMIVYRGRYLNNTDFTSEDQIQIGDVVVVTGNITSYNEVNQLAQGNYLISLVRQPVITATPNPLAVPNYAVGTAEPEYETLIVNGSNLIANISVALNENSNFEMSTDLENWTNSLTLTQSEGSVTDEEVAIRLKAGLAKGNYVGTVTLASTDATDVVVNLSGTVTGQTYTIEQYSSPATAHGTITFSPASPVEDGTEVTLTATPADGYDFTADSWVFYKESGQDYVVDNTIVVTNSKITMPAYNIWVDATFAVKPTYAITCVASPVAGGEIEANPATAYEGQTVTLSYVAATGYTLSSIVITKTSDGSSTGIIPTASGDDFTFTMPGYAVTATATFLSNTFEGSFAQVTATSALEDGGYYILYSTKAMNSTLTSGKMGATDVTINNNIIENPDRSIVWKLVKNGDNWDLYSEKEEKYCYIEGTNTSAFKMAAEASYHYVVTAYATGGGFKFKTTHSSGRGINYGTDNFGSYADSNSPIVYLYKYTTLTERTITFNGNGGTYNEATTYTQVVYDGVSTALTANQFTKANAEFAGWALTADGDVVYADQAEVTINDDLGLYAKWSTLYTLTVDNNIDGGSVSIVGSITSAVEGTEITLSYSPTTGHAFSAWNVYKTGDPETTVTVTDNKFNMPAYNVTVSATFVEATTYSLVTNVSQIVSGKHYIIASGTDGSVKVMAGQNENNRTSVAVTATNGVIPETSGIYEFVINGPFTFNEKDCYTIYDTNANSTGFLYAASSSSNHLRTKSGLDNNGKWTIEIATGSKANIKAQGSNTRNWMRNNGSLFSCYGSGQADIYLYVKDNDTDYEYYGSEITYAGTSIPAGETITIGTGSVMTVSDGFTNNTNNNLIIEDGGQLIHNGNVNATLKKNVAASPTWDSRGVSGWYTIASPVADMAVSCATTGDYDFFAFNEENTKWLNQKVGANNITNFEQGVGYLYANADATVIDYLGTLIGTETEVTKPLSYACENASYQGINLMGNPFSRNLVAGDIEIAGTPLTTYYTVEGGNELTAKTLASTPIKPGQGFMVQATASSQNLVFNPTSKDRSTAKVGYISIVAGNSEFTDNAFVQVGGGNTLHKMTLSDNSSIVYVMNNGNDYAAATIDALEGSMPVCFKANALGSYTITIEAIDINADYLHLIDNFTGEDINLLLEPSYSFIASNGDRAERFTLVFRANGCEGSTNDIFAFQNGSDIVVNGEGELQVFDVTGRMVATQHVNGVQTVNVPSQGVFIFKLNEKTQKIVVR